jgi:primary-amine oxidase
MRAQILAISIVAAAVVAFGGARTAHAGCTSGQTGVQTVTRTFSTGAAWRFNVLHDNCSGLKFAAVQYQPPGGILTTILAAANIAEIHVPYNSGSPRFLDLSTSTAGLGANAVTLSAAECPGGTLIDSSLMCLRLNHDGEGYAWKQGTSFKMDEAIQIFQSSQLGNYNYINLWEFHMDGTIEVKLGLTGALQVTVDTTDPNWLLYGSQLNASNASTKHIGADHQHNAYYRFDFDIDGPPNDVVSRRLVANSTTSPCPPNSPVGTCTSVTMTPITTESAQTWTGIGQNTWVVEDKVSLNADGRRKGYEIVPHETGVWHGRTTSDEPYSGSELWVTTFQGCEILAVGNAVPAIPSFCTPAPPTNVQAYLNGENVDGQDVVVWYAQRFQHHTRDEDDPKMPIEYMSFELQPRGFMAVSPIP